MVSLAASKPPLAAACILCACVAQPGDVIQCRECGYRILYKKRTKQSTSTGSPTLPVFLSSPRRSAKSKCFRRDRFANRPDRPFTGSPSAVVQFEAR